MSAIPAVKNHKFLGGTLGPDGTVYCIPSSSPFVLRVLPASSTSGPIPTVETIDDVPRKGKFKWLRGVTVGEKIFGIPCWGREVLRVCTETQSVSTFGDLTCDVSPRNWNWHGGARSPDGLIYGVPCNANRVLAIDPEKEEAVTTGPLLEGRNKWYGGILGDDGSIYGIPYSSPNVLKIAPGGSITLLGDLSSEGWKWHGP